MAAVRNASPSHSHMAPWLDSHSRVAFASMALKTGCNSPGELEMTCSTSAVAVCCSNAWVNSRVRACTSSNRRAFSIAITAWSANVITSSTCFSLKGRTVVLLRTSTPIGMPSRRSGTPRCVRNPPNSLGLIQSVFWIGQHVVYLNSLAVQQDTAGHAPAPRRKRHRLHIVFKFSRMAKASGRVKSRISWAKDLRQLRLAQARCQLDQRLEHRLEVEGRATDDLEHVGGRGLLM